MINRGRRSPARGPCPTSSWGVSVEASLFAAQRIPSLLRTPAAVRFVSAEPLLARTDFSPYLGDLPEDEDGAPYPGRLDLVIVGGESGRGARPFNLDWAREIRDDCRTAGTNFFMKQIGSRPMEGSFPYPRTKDRKGEDPQEWPEDLRFRELP